MPGPTANGNTIAMSMDADPSHVLISSLTEQGTSADLLSIWLDRMEKIRAIHQIAPMTLLSNVEGPYLCGCSSSNLAKTLSTYLLLSIWVIYLSWSNPTKLPEV